MTGAVVSATVTLKLQLAELPDVSVTVYPTVVVPRGKDAPDASPVVRATVAPLQLSHVEGAEYVTVAAHETAGVTVLISAGQVIEGSCWSWTVILKLHVAVLPAASVAVYTTEYTPMVRLLPLLGPLRVDDTPAQLSAAVGGVYVTVWLHNPVSAFTTILLGHPLYVGASVSRTLTTNEQTANSPAASVALNVTVVLPTGNSEPLAKPAVRTTDCTPQLSAATGAVYVTVCWHCPPMATTAMSLGQTMVGASWSLTATAKEHEAAFPDPSTT